MVEIKLPKFKEWKPEEFEQMNDEEFLLELDRLMLLYNKYLADYSKTRIYLQYICGDYSDLTEKQIEEIKKVTNIPPGANLQLIPARRVISELRKVTELILLYENLMQNVNKIKYYLMYKLPEYRKRYAKEVFKLDEIFSEPKKPFLIVHKQIKDKLSKLDPKSTKDVKSAMNTIVRLFGEKGNKLYRRDIMFIYYNWLGDREKAREWLHKSRKTL